MSIFVSSTPQQKDKDQEVGHQQCGNDDGGDKMHGSQMAGGDVLEALKEGVQEVKSPSYVEDPHQRRCQGPPEAQGQDRKQGQQRGQQVAVGGGIRETGIEGLGCHPRNEECHADVAKAVEEQEGHKGACA